MSNELVKCHKCGGEFDLDDAGPFLHTLECKMGGLHDIFGDLTSKGRSELLSEIARLRIERDKALELATYAKAQCESMNMSLVTLQEEFRKLQREVAEALSNAPTN